MSNLDVEFCLLAERGQLAGQALLLCKSIRRFGGRYASARVTVVSPRKDRRPVREHIQALDQLGVNYVELDLVSPQPEYGPSFRVLALAWCAARSGPGILVQLDSDTVFVAEPDIEAGVAARPVDVTGMCSAGPDDPSEIVWERMAKLCGVDLDAIPFLSTTVDRRRVRASYNSGLVVAPRGFYPVVNDFLLRILHNGVRPYASLGWGFKFKAGRVGAGRVSLAGARFWGTSQAAISLALAATGTSARILDPGHNVPMHMLDDLSDPVLRPVHLHYHWMFASSTVGRFTNRIGRALQHKQLRLSTDQKRLAHGCSRRNVVNRSREVNPVGL